jgi:alkyl sulfatase BDS1-like metallo-beta-lactamase superfamily hydrolase
MTRLRRKISLAAFSILAGSLCVVHGQQRIADNPTDLLRVGNKVIKINDTISMVQGFGNTFLVSTSEGNVIIDTSILLHAGTHKQLLAPTIKGPIKYIILTHAHGDHTGGIPLWKEQGTQIIAQRNHVEFVHYQARLAGFFARRNAAQFALNIPIPERWAGNYGGKIEPTIFFDEEYEFELGGLKFEIYHTPGETPDHLTVWIPKYKVAFTGDNYYESFPNIYTLRGTQPRWALDYVNSLNKVLSLQPDIVLPSHGPAVIGAEQVKKRLTQYRDAIQYVHDETVKGMNAGKDVFTLMREIKLPADLQIGESYGTVAWTVRGIYDGYAGWFNGDPATMYDQPSSSVYADIVKLAGGAEVVARRAVERLEKGDAIEALHLSAIAVSADPTSRAALEARLKALMALRDKCKNSNERGWIDHGIRLTQALINSK